MMGLFSPRNRSQQMPRKHSRLSLLLFLLLIAAALKLLGNPAYRLPTRSQPHVIPPPIFYSPDVEAISGPPERIYHFTGLRVHGNGTNLVLGDRRTHLPGSLLSRFFPDELVIPSCLTQPPPAPQPNQPSNNPLPVRDDWPGFYGAPWVARSNGTLIALLHVYAPRNVALPIAPPEFQLYPSYAGPQTTPAFTTWGQAAFVRGSKAVLYRVFLNGPVRCLDLVVKNGENSGVSHIYYQKYHYYYELDTTFQIQP